MGGIRTHGRLIIAYPSAINPTRRSCPYLFGFTLRPLRNTTELNRQAGRYTGFTICDVRRFGLQPPSRVGFPRPR